MNLFEHQMPHESTVNPYEYVRDDSYPVRRGRIASHTNSTDSRASPLGFSSSSVAALQQQVAATKLSGSGEFVVDRSSCHTHPETPATLTHHEDFDDDDEDSDESKNTTLLEPATS